MYFAPFRGLYLLFQTGKMIIIKRSSDLKSCLKKPGTGITGFIPTMGALHKGHLSLIEQGRAESATTVCSIFVNPTQFNNPADFSKYPVTLEKDIELLEKAGVDILFLPSVQEVYPEGVSALERYDLGYLETVLEGAFRPGHFQGVCQVMSRLIRMVEPEKLFMGQKDYQQCLVIKQLLRIMQSDVSFITCPTVREADGLAMSSRNMRLGPEERKKATGIYQALVHIREHIRTKGPAKVKQDAIGILERSSLKPDYVEIAGGDDLMILQELDAQKKPVALIAAFMNDVRLIDNMIL
jgi:pantoate--beta-alanine ligase